MAQNGQNLQWENDHCSAPWYFMSTGELRFAGHWHTLRDWRGGRVVSTISLATGGSDWKALKYTGVFQQTEGLNIWSFSDTTTRGNDIFLICPRVNIEVANTVQVSETDGKDIFGAKSPVLICHLKYAYAYLNHKDIYIYIYTHNHRRRSKWV